MYELDSLKKIVIYTNLDNDNRKDNKFHSLSLFDLHGLNENIFVLNELFSKLLILEVVKICIISFNIYSRLINNRWIDRLIDREYSKKTIDMNCVMKTILILTIKYFIK